MTNGSIAEAPSSVRKLDTPQSGELAQLAAVFEDLQYVLRCCEHLVTALNAPDSGPARVETDPALIEALWTGALVGYVRCFSGRTRVLTEDDLGALNLEGQVLDFHNLLKRLRDHYASRHVNPRETFTIGVAQANDGTPTGVAVVSGRQPGVDDTTVRQLGRIAYELSRLVDGRMQETQQKVLAAAGEMNATALAALPLVHLSGD
ncbi:hypothetical protein ACFQE5_21975 [Pseudonocardia hispaniensis]|uniref:GAF domain-containing protein n=1 Tax=Pseudonocardia hispaniensis TaxID=904933 RepID=A0ABW1J8G5_9PSEU